MESRLFLIKNVKDVEKTKKLVLEKCRTLVSTDSSLAGDIITVAKTTSWTNSKATISFSKVEKDLEMTLTTEHSATSTAFIVACILFLFTLLLLVVPWYLYDQDKRKFNDNLANVLNYAVSQG